MQHAQAVQDGRERASGLSQAVFSEVGADAAALLAFCASAGAPGYAKLAPRVFAAAAAGDARAMALLQAAADQLLRLVDALQAGHPPLPLVASGSIGQRLAPLWPPAWRERLREPAGDSADGALRLVRAVLDAQAA
jgi:glucosamine kinase